MSLAFFSSSQANLSWTFLQYLLNVTDMLSRPVQGLSSRKHENSLQSCSLRVSSIAKYVDELLLPYSDRIVCCASC